MMLGSIWNGEIILICPFFQLPMNVLLTISKRESCIVSVITCMYINMRFHLYKFTVVQKLQILIKGVYCQKNSSTHSLWWTGAATRAFDDLVNSITERVTLWILDSKGPSELFSSVYETGQDCTLNLGPRKLRTNWIFGMGDW
jgi:hypothetical protein